MDSLSIHQRSTERTKGAINKEVLKALGKKGFLINTSRGPIVDEEALIEALENRVIAGAGLDVYDIEPLPLDHPLRRLDNAVTLPHVGYGSHEVLLFSMLYCHLINVSELSSFFYCKSFSHLNDGQVTIEQSIVDNIRAYVEEGKVLNQIV